MSETTPHSRGFWAGWICAGAFLLIAAVAGVYASNLHNQYDDVELRLIDAVTKLQLSEQRLGDASNELTAMHANLGLLSAPDVQVMTLTGKGIAAETTGRVFVSRSKGLLFSATRVPPLADGSVYQLWLLSHGAPVSAGLARPAQDGSVTAAYDPIPDAPVGTGFAMSVEPENGSSKPTSPFLLVTP